MQFFCADIKTELNCVRIFLKHLLSEILSIRASLDNCIYRFATTKLEMFPYGHTIHRQLKRAAADRYIDALN